jgi:hypothetical protein
VDAPETLRLSPYGLVFAETYPKQFTSKPSETATGIQEYQYRPGGGQRGEAALIRPIAAVKVDDRGKITEILDYIPENLDAVTPSSSAEGLEKLKELFGGLNWGTDLKGGS